MVMQAFVDDSYDESLFVIAGHLATSDAWAALSAEWKRLLPKFGVLGPNGRYRFKMSEMAMLPERLERVAPFYRLIEDHVTASVSVWLRLSDMRRAFHRLWSPTHNLAFLESLRPYDFVFGCLLDWFNKSREEIGNLVTLEFPIDFYFDQQSEKHRILRNWDRFVSHRRADFKEFIGDTPKFEDDEKYLPLQAADLWAWWVREWHEAGTPEQMEMPDFGPFKARRKGHLKIDMHMTEDTLARVMRTSVTNTQPPGTLVYDLTFFLEGRRVP